MKKILLGSAALLVAACASTQAPWHKTEAVAEAAPSKVEAKKAPTVADAQAFIESAEAELAEMGEYAARVYWLQATNINFDSNWLVSKVGAKTTEAAVRLANGTKQFEGMDLPADLARKMAILKAGITIPAPSTEGAADELATLTTRLDSTYSTGTFEYKGEKLNLTQLSNIIAESRDPEELATVWTGWREISKPMKDDYARMVEIANEGARELGFKDTADMWLANYDMPSADMEKEVERLWTQVEPLYDQLHCKVRADLNEKYGDDVQSEDGFIRADLLGNMWAQQWSNIYDVVGPQASGPSYDVTTKLEEKGYTPLKMVEVAEDFFTSMGLDPLPETFWERSQITRPRDREVVCHASAWDLDSKDDIRIKMCTQVNSEDFQTVHHELGHNYYQRAYKNQDYLHQNGAHDGFHEAIGDFLALSITPSYLKDIGLIEESEIPDASADTGLLMNQALDKIAFLPFGLMVDKWRWQVFRGETTPEEYNDAWVKLRQEYQGITPPTDRPMDAFDPGSKYHIPGNTPYLRYFLSFVMQFQFHKAACEMSGWEGPLHRCSIYNNKEVGTKFNAMMEMGASKPWPDALEAFTGTREMDGSAIIEYFDPLMTYLKEENEGRSCGWK
ncbi:M2 family metallopeptidase [Hirschia litorea]|uniref:M2 family metallopeptidase n=1 Tax=Hirschia litorea TaxID=1199156 RepID=A0ABW2ILG2_9PROT